MNKYSLISILIFISSNYISAQSQKIGYVDSQVILTQFAEAIKAQGDFDALTNTWSGHFDSLQSDYQNNLVEYQKKAVKMPEKEKLSFEQKLVNENNDIAKFKQEKYAQGIGEIYKKHEEIFGPVNQKILNAIKEIATKEDIKFVFNKANDDVLLYVEPQYDLTYKVLDYLKTGGK